MCDSGNITYVDRGDNIPVNEAGHVSPPEISCPLMCHHT